MKSKKKVVKKVAKISTKKKSTPKKGKYVKKITTRAYSEPSKYSMLDSILAQLMLPSPCPVEITIGTKAVSLRVGPRDFSWDRKSGELLGAGTLLYEEQTDDAGDVIIATEVERDNAAGSDSDEDSEEEET